MRVAISVEGATEREFVGHLLAPHLARSGADVTPIVLTTKRVVAGPNQRGGSVNLDRVASELPRLLGSFDIVTTIYDYYGFGGRGQRTPEELEAAIHRKLNRSLKLIPYVQVHEFEALMFVDPNITAAAVGSPTAGAALEQIVRRFPTPEDINDDPMTVPSRRLKAALPSYDKIVHGPDIAARIGLPRLRAACPRFGRWLTALEAKLTHR